MRTIYLMGLRGSGKSTLGRALAAQLNLSFIDLDSVTPRLLNSPSVADAWATHGEPAFRAAELRALADPAVTSAGVIALGGGTPTAPGAEQLLLAARAAGARLIYLRASAHTLRQRLLAADNSHRPSLTGTDPLAEIEAVLAARDGLYQRLASTVLAIDGHDESTTLAELVRTLA